MAGGIINLDAMNPLRGIDSMRIWMSSVLVVD